VADEMFVILGWAWDINTATRLPAAYPVQQTDLKSLAWARHIIKIDTSHAAEADLTRPLLAVPIPDVQTPLVIDGWHRIHRALESGIDELPAVLLSAQDERACRIRGGGVPDTDA
jgi:hypothetical protein